jgi:hypothetical protein
MESNQNSLSSPSLLSLFYSAPRTAIVISAYYVLGFRFITVHSKINPERSV